MPGTVVLTPPSSITARSRRLAHVPPNWFAAVMGTGIVGTAAASLPLQSPGLRVAATAVWALAAVLLIGVVTATALHWRWFREAALQHHRNPVTVHFYGAVPMAVLTVGAGTLLLGKDVIGPDAAVAAASVLWVVGTLLGLVTAVAVPYLTVTRIGADGDAAFGGWLMPVVPPMVSAATGALLLPYAPAGQLRLTLLLCCYALFGMSLIASVVVITLIWARLARGSVGPAAMVPTLWIVLGPLGQSITAANLLGGNAHLVVPAPWSTALDLFGLLYGIPVLGFAVLWAVLAAALTLRTARRHLPFTLSWWSFTFPVGTCVTGLSALAAHSGSAVLGTAAVALYVVLVPTWLLVATRTLHGAVRGTLLAPPPSVTPTPPQSTVPVSAAA